LLHTAELLLLLQRLLQPLLCPRLCRCTLLPLLLLLQGCDSSIPATEAALSTAHLEGSPQLLQRHTRICIHP
jgi:hypothetical protein